MVDVGAAQGASGAKPPENKQKTGDSGTFNGAVNQMIGPMVQKSKNAIVNGNAEHNADKQLLALLQQILDDLVAVMNDPTTANAKKLFLDVQKLEGMKKTNWGKGLSPSVGKAIAKQVDAQIDKAIQNLEDLPNQMGTRLKEFLAKPSNINAYAQDFATDMSKANSVDSKYWGSLNAILGNMGEQNQELTDISKVQLGELQMLMANLQTLLQAASKVTDKAFQTVKQMISLTGQ